MKVNTQGYENSTGKAPRGFGLWIFQNEDTGETCECNDLYSKAKKSAAEYFRSELQPNKSISLILLP